jgi:hypothetical protein
MYLLGYTDPTLTMCVYQQLIDMGEGGVQTLEQAIGCTIAEAFILFPAGAYWHPIGTRARKSLPARCTERAGRGRNGSGTGTSRKRLKGLEPSTFCMASRRSSQLSYSRARPAV